MTTYDYFQRAFRRGAQARAGTSGMLIQAADGNCAIFWLDAAEGVIRGARYRCTTCVTLLAFCEHLSELAVGTRLEQALRISSGHLLALHKDVPHYKADRATLASEAFHSAVHQVTKGAPS
ncbi:MAG: iron-sulfur cluster assembly scaffold protein [Bryobacteraceae bacterium]